MNRGESLGRYDGRGEHPFPGTPHFPPLVLYLGGRAKHEGPPGEENASRLRAVWQGERKGPGWGQELGLCCSLRNYLS